MAIPKYNQRVEYNVPRAHDIQRIAQLGDVDIQGLPPLLQPIAQRITLAVSQLESAMKDYSFHYLRAKQDCVELSRREEAQLKAEYKRRRIEKDRASIIAGLRGYEKRRVLKTGMLPSEERDHLSRLFAEWLKAQHPELPE